MTDVSGRDVPSESPVALSADGSTIVTIKRVAGVPTESVVMNQDGSLTMLPLVDGCVPEPQSVSADGSVIVGYYTKSDGTKYPFLYQVGRGYVDMGVGTDGAGSMHVSADGKVVTGRYNPTPGVISVFRYTEETGVQDIGNLLGVPGGSTSVYAISADGSVIVGDATADPVLGFIHHAYRYDVDTGMADLGTLGGLSSTAWDVSADGQIVVGSAAVVSGDMHAFRYQQSMGVMEDLGTLGGNSSVAKYISANGQVIVGESLTAEGNNHAFRYTDHMTDAGTLGGANSQVAGVSADGSVMVGTADLASGDSHAFRMVNDDPMQDLGTLGGNNSQAVGVSADGKVVTGSSTTAKGATHTFLWRELDDGGGAIIDVDNTLDALNRSAARQQALLDMTAARTQSLMETTCDALSGKWCLVSGASYAQNRDMQQSGNQIGMGYRFSPSWQAGFSVDNAMTQDLPGQYQNAGTALPALAASLDYRQQADGQGWSVRAAVGWSQQTLNLKRDVEDYTEAASGQATVSSKLASLSASYALQAGKASLRPEGGLRYESVTRTGYQETSGGHFLSSYDPYGRRALTAFLAVSAVQPLTDYSSLASELEIEHDVSSDVSQFSANVDQLGQLQAAGSAGRQTRSVLSVGLDHQLSPSMVLSERLSWQQQALGNEVLGLNAHMKYQF